MKTVFMNFLLCASLAFMLSVQAYAQQNVKLHYLGHASFVLDFNDGITVLTDFGTSNCWGYNSPIYGIGDFIPLIMTYSHYHDDHYDPDRVPGGVQYTLDLLDSLSIMDLSISPVRTCETTPGVESNTSFTFNYMGFRICHLGDAQAEIMNIADPAQQALILEKFPDRIDVLLMTIEGVHQFIPEAEMFIDLLQPGMVIPMHYWSPEYKEEFLTYLELQNDTAGKNYEVNRIEGPFLEVAVDDTIHNSIRVYGLTPYPFGETGIKHEAGSVRNASIYPNPTLGLSRLSFLAKDEQHIICEILDMNGKTLIPATRVHCNEGLNNILLDLGIIPAGIYILNLRDSGNSFSLKFVKR